MFDSIFYLLVPSVISSAAILYHTLAIALSHTCSTVSLIGQHNVNTPHIVWATQAKHTKASFTLINTVCAVASAADADDHIVLLSVTCLCNSSFFLRSFVFSTYWFVQLRNHQCRLNSVWVFFFICLIFLVIKLKALSSHQ